MNEKVRKGREHEIGTYTRSLADNLGLRDWTFEISFGSIKEKKAYENTGWTSQATCEPVPGQKKAFIRFREDAAEWEPEEIRSVVVHELMHCHFNDIHELCRTGLLDHFSQQAYDIFMNGFELAWENSVYAVGKALEIGQPLILWPR